MVDLHRDVRLVRLDWLRAPAGRGEDRGVKAAVYARVSTDEQAREGHSLAEQQRLALERAVCDAAELDPEHTYVDALSGKRADRPEYQRMLADAAAGAFETLYVWKFDRLGRDAEELLRARRMLEAAGVRIVSLTEGEAESTLVYGVRALVAQEEREKIVERSRMGLAAVAREGGWKGGPPPLGYRSIGNRAVEVDEAEAAIVHRIDDLYLGGLGAPKIAMALNADGIPTRMGRRWTKVQVLKILDNPWYVGQLQFRGEIYEGNHEPIRDVEVWQRIRAIRNARSSSVTGGRGAEPRRHLLTKGMLRCVCGQSMSARTFRQDRGHGRQYDYYLCRGREDGRCDLPSVRREAIDEPLLAMFETHVLDVDATLAQIRGEADRQIRECHELARAAELELVKLDDALTRVQADYVAGEISAADWKQLRAEIRSDRAGAAAELKYHRSHQGDLAEQTALLDAEEELAGQLVEIRDLVAGRITESGTVDAIRAALTATFERFDLCETSEGFVAVPRLRAERQLEVPRTPDEMLLPAKRVPLVAREATSGGQRLLPESLVETLFAAIPVAIDRSKSRKARA